MAEIEARIETRAAAYYLRNLSEGWNHTYPVRHDTLTGEVVFPAGQLVMTADEDSLVLRLVVAAPEGLDDLRALVERHVRHIENDARALTIDWQPV